MNRCEVDLEALDRVWDSHPVANLISAACPFWEKYPAMAAELRISREQLQSVCSIAGVDDAWEALNVLDGWAEERDHARTTPPHGVCAEDK